MHEQHQKLASAAVLSYFIDSMNIKQKIIYMTIGLSAAALGLLASPMASAAEEPLKCAGADTSIISCKADNKGTETSGVWQLLIMVLQIMTAGVGILAVGGIVYGAVLYTTATDKAEQTKKAIGIITNVVIGIFAYGLMYVVLNFLIPGGLFKP